MPSLLLASEAAGVAVIAEAARRFFLFREFQQQQRRLSPPPPELDESSFVLAKFDINSRLNWKDRFFFGLAAAPAHNEDSIQSLWSDIDADLLMVKVSGASVFRVGLDWGKIMPKEPLEGVSEAIDFAAMEQYVLLLEKIHSYGIKVMLTLYDHYLPPWAQEYGGWTMEKTVGYFCMFTRLIVDNMSELVDYWITFSEPHVLSTLIHPSINLPVTKQDVLRFGSFLGPGKLSYEALNKMAFAHSFAYDYIRTNSPANVLVGASLHVSVMRPYGLYDVRTVDLADSVTQFPFLDSICTDLDFIGINYYGQNIVHCKSLKLANNVEYSESGYGVYPDGLYHILLKYHNRYKGLKLPFIITENGISDATDLVKPPYLLEHLLAVYSAMQMGVPVLGYVFATISDFYHEDDEGSPKFGLLNVEKKENQLARIPSSSFYLFSKVVKMGFITKDDRVFAWKALERAAQEGKTRPLYQAVKRNGLMDAGKVDNPIQRAFVKKDWRFGKCSLEEPMDTWSRLSRSFHIFGG